MKKSFPARQRRSNPAERCAPNRQIANVPGGLVASGAAVVETPIERLCELDRRSGNGIDVVLVWEPATNCVFVGVVDRRTGDEFAVEVDPASALDAFHHPFAYERRRAQKRYVTAEI